MVEAVKCSHRKGILVILGKLQLNLKHIISTSGFGYTKRRSIAECTPSCRIFLIKLLVPAVENDMAGTEKHVHDTILNIYYRITFVTDSCRFLRKKHNCFSIG